MKTYKTRIGLEILLPVIILIALLVFLAFNHNERKLLSLALLAAVLFLHWFLRTYYTISEKTLKVMSGFYYDETIDIDKVKRIIEVTDIFSAPATSIKRLLIQFNDSESVLISPKDKLNFIKELTQINPTIEVKLKN